MMIFISGPIKGHDDFRERFRNISKSISNTMFDGKYIRVINPAPLSDIFPNQNDDYYQEKCFDMIRYEADALYMMKGWEKSHGASMEYGFARGMGKKIFFEEG